MEANAFRKERIIVIPIIYQKENKGNNRLCTVVF